MQPTSAFCRRANGSGAGGFTLLELLLVMALVALLTGLVAPRMWQWVQGAKLRGELDSVRAEIESLPRHAFADAKRIGVDAKDPVPLPTGWRLELSTPLVYEANGMTAGSRVRISSADRAVLADWVIDAPAGTVRNAQPADGPFRVPSAP